MSGTDVLDLTRTARRSFDRVLVFEAIANQMTILTPDPMIARYPAHRRVSASA